MSLTSNPAITLAMGIHSGNADLLIQLVVTMVYILDIKNKPLKSPNKNMLQNQTTTIALQVPPECTDRIQKLVSFLIEKDVKGDGELQAALIDAACMLLNSINELESRERTSEEEGFLVEKKEHLKTLEEFFAFFPLEKPTKKDLNYYALYLRHYLTDEDDPRANDEEFINGRADTAAAHYEECRLQGMSVDQAQESAMKVLLDNIG